MRCGPWECRRPERECGRWCAARVFVNWTLGLVTAGLLLWEVLR